MDVGAAGPAEVRETHSAWVFMVGDRAYKLKKPVDLGFLDFRTREAREAIAHREVDLNRRLAPDVYLGVADVIGTDGEVCDHLVVMRRMPDDRRLASLVGQGADARDEVRSIARAVAEFHARADTSAEITAMGSPEAVREKLDTDLDQLAPFRGAPLEPVVIDEVATLARRYVDGRGSLLTARCAAGMIRDGHGDLLADDIFCLDDGPRILDCIEFDDRLRHGDVLADVAFLAMDLERLGAPDLAKWFVRAYDEWSGEHHPASLVHYYVAARALIRAKVSCIRAAQGDADAADTAIGLMGLARGHLRYARVRLVIVGGPPGTGKSTLATGLARANGWALLRSDEVRKELAGVEHGDHTEAALGEGIYDEATTESTYKALLDRSRTALRMGESVVVDASWARTSWRAAAGRVARETTADLVELRCDAPAEVAGARIASRQAEGRDVSDATPAIGAAIWAAFDPWPAAVVISTTEAVDDALQAALDITGE